MSLSRRLCAKCPLFCCPPNQFFSLFATFSLLLRRCTSQMPLRRPHKQTNNETPNIISVDTGYVCAFLSAASASIHVLCQHLIRSFASISCERLSKEYSLTFRGKRSNSMEMGYADEQQFACQPDWWVREGGNEVGQIYYISIGELLLIGHIQ